jgi:hypothetical protein
VAGGGRVKDLGARLSDVSGTSKQILVSAWQSVLGRTVTMFARPGPKHPPSFGAPAAYEPPQGKSQDLSALVRLKQAAFVEALGRPSDACPARDSIPRTYGVDLVYDFFRLEPYNLGGAPHLALVFDSTGTCSKARWFITK